MKKLQISLVVASVFVSAALSEAQTIAQWTYETSQPAGSGSTISGILPEVGSGEASGFHASTATTWSNPVGNGSPESFSANNWSIGDYYQFQTSTLGYQDIMVSWDQTRSSTGPATFDFAYSLDGVNFTVALDDYTVPAISWSSLTPDETMTTSFSVDLSSILALNNAPTVYFRLIAESAPTSTGGSNRNDNFTVAVIPEPHSLALFGGLALLGFSFCRRRKTN